MGESLFVNSYIKIQFKVIIRTNSESMYHKNGFFFIFVQKENGLFYRIDHGIYSLDEQLGRKRKLVELTEFYTKNQTIHTPKWAIIFNSDEQATTINEIIEKLVSSTLLRINKMTNFELENALYQSKAIHL